MEDIVDDVRSSTYQVVENDACGTGKANLLSLSLLYLRLTLKWMYMPRCDVYIYHRALNIGLSLTLGRLLLFDLFLILYPGTMAMQKYLAHHWWRGPKSVGIHLEMRPNLPFRHGVVLK